MSLVRLTEADCKAKRQVALRELGMTLEEARAQWDDCGCCLINGNWEDSMLLDEVKAMDFLLGE